MLPGCPGNSPVLHPIERASFIVGARVRSKRSASLEALKRIIDQEVSNKLVMSFMNLMRKLVAT
jgi:hypothetical protein